MKALCICEKHSLMKEIKNVYDKINFKDHIDFVALHGHCLTLCHPEDYDPKYKNWNKNLLPIFPEKWKYKPIDKELVKDINNKIKCNSYDYLINATDSEREGQNIFYSLYSYLNLKLPVKRIWLNDLNFLPIKYAIENMRDDLNEPFLRNLTVAAKCRAYSDWLVGMNFTRATGIKIGRVKTPTLEILYKRELEIRNFKPETHYEMKADAGFLLSNDLEFNTEKECKDYIEKNICKGLKNVDGLVTKYESKESREYAPLLFSLGELQSEANKAYGFTLKETLDIAQSLYEKKITTYPRTDCPYLPSGDAQRIPDMIDILKDIVDMKVKLTTTSIPSRYVDDSKVQAHGAIILTGFSFDMSDLEDNEQKIVILIAKRILATLMGPIITNKTKVEVDISDHIFKGNGTLVIDEGFSALYSSTKKNIKIPLLREKQAIEIYSVEPIGKTTTCPNRYNDSTLVKSMINIGNTLSDKEKAILKGTGDQGGIGTPATRAAIVESLLENNKNSEPWVKRSKKAFYVTETGMTVAEKLKNYSFASASLTADWEEKLSKIVDGKYDQKDYNDDLNKYITEQTEELKKMENNTSNFNNSLNCICPKCGGKMHVGKFNYYCENKVNESCDFAVSKDFNGASITEKDIEDICAGKQTRVLKMHSKTKNKDYNARLYFNNDNQSIAFSFDNTSEKSNKENQGKNSSGGTLKCKCGGNIKLHKGQYGEFYSCDNCDKKVSKVYRGKNLSDSDVTKLFNNKKVAAEFMKKDNSGKYKGKIFLNADNKIEFEFSSK